jgi:hypothetical protein
MDQLVATAPATRATKHLELLDADGHVCAFFHSVDEEYLVLLPFIKEGLDHAERVFLIVDPARREEHIRRLVGAGIDVVDAEARGQLVVLDWSQTFLCGGGFVQDRMMSQFADARKEGRSQGYPRTRFVSHMEWALETDPLKLAEYEATANFAPRNGDVAICAYQLERWGSQLLVKALRTHPLVILGGLLHQNPFYQPPVEFLAELTAGEASACC